MFNDLVTIFFIALGLSVDAFILSATSSMSVKYVRIKSLIHLPIVLGVFHLLMPIIGSYAGSVLIKSLPLFNPWIPFLALFAIGIKFLFEKPNSKKISPFESTKVLLVLGFATSVDAIVVGFSLNSFGVNYFVSAIIIGIVTTAMALFGMFLGIRIKRMFKFNLNVFAGIVLILISIKILFMH